MKQIKWMFVIVLLVMFMPFSVMAGGFDGSEPLLFVLQEVYECSPENGCKDIEDEDINLPSLLIINFKKKEITATPESGRKDVSKIERIERKDGMLYLQGAEDGYEGGVVDGVGWTLAIEEDSGKGVLTGAMPGAAFVVFGVCTPQ